MTDEEDDEYQDGYQDDADEEDEDEDEEIEEDTDDLDDAVTDLLDEYSEAAVLGAMIRIEDAFLSELRDDPPSDETRAMIADVKAKMEALRAAMVIVHRIDEGERDDH